MAGYKEYVIDFKIGDGTTHSIPLKIPLGENGGYYTPSINQISETEIEISYVPSMADMPTIKPAVIKIPGSGGNSGHVVQDTPPEDNSVLWVDPTDNSDDGFQEAVNAALAKAKESGIFNPVKGKDYFTEDDKAEMVAYMKSQLQSEQWIFELEDGATVTKDVMLG